MKNLFKKISLAIVLLAVFSMARSTSLFASGIFIESIQTEGSSLVISVHVPPNYFNTTFTPVEGGVAYADITSPQSVSIQASNSSSFDNIINQSYTVPSGVVVVLSNGDIPEEFTFPISLLTPNTPYFFRVKIGDFYSNVVSLQSVTNVYGETLVPQDDFSPYVEFFVDCGASFGENYSLTSTSMNMPCLVTSKFENTSVQLKIAWGTSAEGTTNLGPMTLNTILNGGQEFTFLANIPNLTPNTSYVFKIVDAESPNLSYTPAQNFTTTASDEDGGEEDGATTVNPVGGSQYGVGDDTDFNSEEYKQSLVKCNGTPTNPCRFSHLADLINRVVKFLIIMILPLSAILFAYAGFLYLTSGGNTETKAKVTKMLTKAVAGIVIVLAAWLIVKTIFWAVGASSDINLLDGADQSQDEILNGN